MNFILAILKIFNTQSAIPTPFGPYHIFCIVLVCLMSVYAIRRGKHHDERKIRKVLLYTAIMVLSLETYKQINYTFGDGTSAPQYLWYAFPFQFCSTPMYVGLLAALLPKGKLHDAMCAYLSTYAVFAGFCVMMYPNDVFTYILGINIQTMVWHGSMVVIGLYLIGAGYVKLEGRTVLKAMPVFATCVAIAAVMNEVAHRAGIGDFNMFFISPYQASTLPVYSLIHDAVPFPVNLAIYVLGFSVAAYLVICICRSVRYLWTKLHIRSKVPAYR